MQFVFPTEEVICYKCFWFRKGLSDEERVIKSPNCSFYEADFGNLFTLKNRCVAFRDRVEISLPSVRKIRE